MFHLFFCPQIHHHMIAAVGLAQGIIEFCYLLLVLFPVGKLDPQFPRHLIEGDDFFADQLARLIILRGNTALDLLRLSPLADRSLPSDKSPR